MEYLGYIAAVLIGVLLGLIGAGGSILTIPVLVYLIGIPPVNATSYSLFIVGISAFIGGLRYMRNNLICIRTVLVFGLPSVLGIFLTRKYLLHRIPEHIAQFGSVEITKDAALMILLAGLMIAAAWSMIRKPSSLRVDQNRQNEQYRYFLILQQGIIVGALVGLVGAGGGFLIIPALVMLAKLPMKKAIGTSLVIIALNSSVGFLSDFGAHQFNWNFLLLFSAFAISGIIVGTYLNRFVSGAKLKPGFGWFILLMGIYIIGKELFWT
ncbi:MAG: sulfite exporter TauE/SafE family protein [Bacteroidia bacterium]